MRSASAPADTVAGRIGEFVAGLQYSDIPAEVRQKAKVTVLHDLGVALAGHSLVRQANAAARYLAGESPAGARARLLIDGGRVGLEAAALATGALIHARSQDDIYLPGRTHLGATTLPALLALADERDSSGEAFLTAMVAGYEAACALSAAHGDAVAGRGFRATSVFGPLAAAAASARLLGCSAGQTVSALGLAASFAGGTNQTWAAGTGEWQYQVGSASRNGMVAAVLASHGVSGAPDGVEGVAGLLKAFSGDVRGADELGTQLGTDWRMNDVTFKPYPVCALNQIPVTLLVQVLTEHDLSAAQVQGITLAMPPHDASYPGLDSKGPFADVGAALMSAAYCSAIAVHERTVRLSDMRRFDDPALIALTQKITLVGDAELPVGSVTAEVRSDFGPVSARFDSTPATFNWGWTETLERLRGVQDDMPFPAESFARFAGVVCALDTGSARELIDATIVPS
jgi:2-methylcitrate dehydratase PrpD